MSTNIRIITMMILALCIASACTLTDEGEEVELTPIPGDLTGTWVSKEGDLAILFQDIIQSLTLEFNYIDSTYMLTQMDASGDSIIYIGDFRIEEASETGNIFSIKLQQFQPDTLVYDGIYEINTIVTANELSIEWVQTYPDLGHTLPLITEGFGSSEFGVEAIQKYRKQ